MRKHVRFFDINHQALSEMLSDTNPVFNGHDIDGTASYISDSIYIASVDCQSDQPDLVLEDSVNRWSHFIANNDSKTLWKAIGWNGNINRQVSDQPGAF